MFMWMAVHTQRDSVKMQDVMSPTVPLPVGSGTYAGDEGLVGDITVKDWNFRP
jgi:hypothetical protein